MAISKLLRSSLSALLALSAPSLAALACSDGTRSTIEEATPAANTGRMSLALTARGASGALYRLRQASFQAFQQDGFNFVFLSSENDPASTTLEATLESGQYSIELFPGWRLEKLEGGSTSVVNATLLSPALQFFSISANEETFVSYRFETNGEVIDFGQGRLIIDIQVDEVNGGGGGGGNLGDALEIVDGVINPGTNEHGIQAGLFTAAADVGATIAVTENTGSVCVSGLIDPVLNEDFATQWGALFGLEFLSEALEPAAWDRDGGNVLGFSFSITGQTPILRFQATPDGTPTGSNIFCENIFPSGEPVAGLFESMTFECWMPGGLPLPPGNLTNVIWQLVSVPELSQPYDFCVSDLRPILQ